MDGEAQARAYAAADFREPHDRFVTEFRERFPDPAAGSHVLDLGCGPADVTVRFARAYPGLRVDGVDGAEAMLRLGRRRLAEEGLEDRVTLVLGRLPGARLPRSRYQVLISNSLLHHLADPQVLWRSMRAYGDRQAPVLIMDLMRPPGEAQLRTLVGHYAGDAPPVLRRDFEASLRAAYTVPEIEGQLAAAGLSQLRVAAISDRHCLIWGRMH